MHHLSGRGEESREAGKGGSIGNRAGGRTRARERSDSSTLFDMLGQIKPEGQEQALLTPCKRWLGQLLLILENRRKRQGGSGTSRCCPRFLEEPTGSRGNCEWVFQFGSQAGTRAGKHGNRKSCDFWSRVAEIKVLSQRQKELFKEVPHFGELKDAPARSSDGSSAAFRTYVRRMRSPPSREARARPAERPARLSCPP